MLIPRNLFKAFLLLFTLLSTLIFSQKKKELVKYSVQTISTTETANGKTITDNKITYDGNGQVIEEINYDKLGVLKTTVRYKYKNGAVEEEIELDGKNVVKEKRRMQYNSLNEKTEELVTDKDGKVIKKMKYLYNSQGFKSERNTFDAEGKLVSVKKYIYAYDKNMPKPEPSAKKKGKKKNTDNDDEKADGED